MNSSKVNVTKVLVLTLAILAVAHFANAAEGTVGGGGGDRCEARFKDVAKDLANWIQAGGAKRMHLPAHVDQKTYAKRMLTAIAKTRITCVGPGDKGYPVVVSGSAKECRNYVDARNISRILCDRAKFYTDSADPENNPVQYTIVHHEYASLAGLEPPDQDDSNYVLSNQITGFLEDQTIKRLVVNPSGSTRGLVILGGAGYSEFNDTTNPPTYYGGVAGMKQHTGTPNSTTPFDSCAHPPPNVPLFACNNAAIYGSLPLTITFQSSSVDGAPSISAMTFGMSQPTQLATVTPPAFVRHGHTASVTIRWSTICALMVSVGSTAIDSNCSLIGGTGGSATYVFTAAIDGTSASSGAPATDSAAFRITIADGGPNVSADGSSTVEACDPINPANDSGVCHFEITPGNGSVHVEHLFSSPGFPRIYEVPIVNLVVLWAAGHDAFSKIISPSTETGSNFAFLSVASDAPSDTVWAQPSTVSGLINGKEYSFKIALQDAAGNIGYYTATDPHAPDSLTGADYSCIYTSNPTGTGCHMATPAKP